MPAPLRILLLACACSVLLTAAPAGATPPLPDERIAAGVTAAGIDLSGLTVDEATGRLESIRSRIENGVITVLVADITFKLKTTDAGAALDASQTSRRALYAGRVAAGSPVDVALAVSWSKASVAKFAASVSKRLRREARDARVVITVRKVKVTHSARGRDIDTAALAKRLQKAIVDPRAARVLKPRLEKVKPKVTADAAAKTASTVITIEQSKFKLRLFKHGKVVKTYGVAVGQPRYPTPNGRFAIQDKQVNPVWSVPNSPWAGELGGSTVAGGSAANPLKARWMGIAGGVGIHGTGDDYSIGSRASHGCIRMHVSDVVPLFARVPVGTPVLIAP